MRQCPNCGTQYTDDSLRYCLQDGTPLIAPTARLDPEETETVISNRTRAEAVEPTVVGARAPERAARGRKGIVAAVALLAGALIVLIGAMLAGYLLFVRDRQPNPNAHTPTNTNSSPAPTPTATPRVSPTPSPSPSQTATPAASPSPIDTSRISREISDSVDRWADDTSSGDIDSLMSDYADTVDYYRSGGVPRGAIRQDKLRAFSKYDSVEVTTSNMSVTVDDSGEAATVEFDKHWLFEGENVYEGRARSQLKFRRINGKWLITSEKDLKVY